MTHQEKETKWTWADEAEFVSALKPHQLEGYAVGVRQRVRDFEGRPIAITFQPSVERLIRKRREHLASKTAV